MIGLADAADNVVEHALRFQLGSLHDSYGSPASSHLDWQPPSLPKLWTQAVRLWGSRHSSLRQDSLAASDSTRIELMF